MRRPRRSLSALCAASVTIIALSAGVAGAASPFGTFPACAPGAKGYETQACGSP